MRQELSVEEMRRHTQELMGDDFNIDHITDDYATAEVAGGALPTKSAEANYFYFSWMAYGRRNGKPTYEFWFSDGSLNGVCQPKNRSWVYQEDYDHNFHGYCVPNNSNSAVLYFTPR